MANRFTNTNKQREDLIYAIAKGVASESGLQASYPVGAISPLVDANGDLIENSVDRAAYEHIRLVYFSKPSRVLPEHHAQASAAFDLRDEPSAEMILAKCQMAVADIEDLELRVGLRN